MRLAVLAARRVDVCAYHVQAHLPAPEWTMFDGYTILETLDGKLHEFLLRKTH